MWEVEDCKVLLILYLGHLDGFKTRALDISVPWMFI